jgi:NAD+ synthase (glutamine-hydrolysing)
VFIMADVDVEQLTHERLKNSSFSATPQRRNFRRVDFSLASPDRETGKTETLLRRIAPHPFVPEDPAMRAANCLEVFTIQATGLAKRLLHTGVRKVTLGISGGLDSTLALLVTVRAFDRLGLSRSGIICPTMPGFGTTGRTRTNAEKLVELLGATLLVLPIQDAVRQHFETIGHEETVYDVTYENAQARERTQILMDLANKHSGFVVGTGDLSESALGWCTYNGDHMSMYHVNVGVPKTLVRYLIEWCAEEVFTGEAAEVLRDICATPITPELLPTAVDGSLEQRTEAAIGPYELHDFFLFYVVRHQFTPLKILFLAQQAFPNLYERREILHWLRVFYQRFFSNQYKRSCVPDGPKVGSVALSPRGDWRMPSDGTAAIWLSDVDYLLRIDEITKN